MIEYKEVGGRMKTNVIYQGKFQEQADKVEPGSVDLILTDPPYGIIDNYDGCEWDEAISPIEIFETANRILRKNGRLILFSKEPYTTELMKNKPANLTFNQKAIWVKDVHGNGAQLKCNKALLGYYEEIMIFSKQNPINETEFIHPLRKYFTKVKEFISKPKTSIMDKIGQKVDHTFRVDSTQFSLCTQETYQELIDIFDIDQMEGFRKYSGLEQVDEHTKNKMSSTFNLPKGQEYKEDVFNYSRVYNKKHPTQKPVALLGDLIKTYTNEGDLVVDLTAGSGSTGVVARYWGRKYILIERKQEYIDIAKKRLNEQKLV